MSLHELRTTVHEKEEELFIYQGLWYNNNIKINNSNVFYKTWYDKGITFIYDLLNQYGAWLSYQDFSEKYNFHPPITVFYGLRQCILKEWQTLRYDRYQAVLPHYHEFIKNTLKISKTVQMFMIFLCLRSRLVILI